MLYHSTNNKNIKASFSEAVLRGIAPDGGLYFPETLPRLDQGVIDKLSLLDIVDISIRILRPFADDIPEEIFRDIVEGAFSFDAPLVRLDKCLSVLELFHGPTLAFKDFGARFLAKTIAHLNEATEKETIVLVATSGDTGSAVGNGFMNMPGIHVGLLYPSGKVSRIQEQQLTTMGGNIQAFEVQGDFDDCQRLVKQAFVDDKLREAFNLSSANSINIARLLPQAVYYFRAVAQLENNENPPVFIVPSGNFGNLTAGLVAWKMGLPVYRFVAAVNKNAVFKHYLDSGEYVPGTAYKTYSNAMDVGDPNNFIRILELFDHHYETIRSVIYSESISDDQTLEGIRQCLKSTGYTLDPHSAVGYQTYKKIRRRFSGQHHFILLETAHPSKFADIVEKAVNAEIPIPDRLSSCLNKRKNALQIPADFNYFRERLLTLFCD